MDAVTDVPVKETCCLKCSTRWQRFKKQAGWELFQRAPNDFRAAIVILFLESLAMFNFFNVLMWILTEDAGFSDRAAGWIFGMRPEGMRITVPIVSHPLYRNVWVHGVGL